MHESTFQAQTRPSPKRAWQMPTHLGTPDTLFTLAFLRLTTRQLLVLVVGWSLVVQLFRATWALAARGTAGSLVRLLLCALPFVFALLVAFFPVAGRPPESWLLVLCRFSLSPHVWVWRRPARRSVSSWPSSGAADVPAGDFEAREKEAAA
jgi:hypothetical protein